MVFSKVDMNKLDVILLVRHLQLSSENKTIKGTDQTTWKSALVLCTHVRATQIVLGILEQSLQD